MWNSPNNDNFSDDGHSSSSSSRSSSLTDEGTTVAVTTTQGVRVYAYPESNDEYSDKFQAVAVRRLGYLFDMGAIKYHKYKCTRDIINTRRTYGTIVKAGGAIAIPKECSIDEWAALTYDEQCDVYRKFQGALHPSCQQHLNALATHGRLDPYAIDELKGQLKAAESYINRQIEKLLHDDDVYHWRVDFSQY